MAAFAILAAIGKRTVQGGIQDTNRSTILFKRRGKAVSPAVVAKEVERMVDEQIRRAGF